MTQVAVNMMAAQLKSAAQAGSPTDGAMGKLHVSQHSHTERAHFTYNENRKLSHKKHKLSKLSGKPSHPSFHRLGSSTSPRMRLSVTQLTEMM
jgi:hypothetical protein